MSRTTFEFPVRRRVADRPERGGRGDGRDECAAEQVEHDGRWALALPFAVVAPSEELRGALCLARRGRRFQDDEIAVATRLIEKARTAAADILSHHELRTQAVTDALTGLGNRRKLFTDLAGWWQRPEPGTSPSLLMLFDLDGFKSLQRHLRPLGRRRAAGAPRRQAEPPRSPRTARPTGWAATSSACCSESTSIVWTTWSPRSGTR